jgi:hypothetical protein
VIPFFRFSFHVVFRYVLIFSMDCNETFALHSAGKNNNTRWYYKYNVN